MLKLKPETTEALKAGRVRYFIFFDFMFEPMRVHCGDGPNEWDGHAWTGTGDVLRTNLSHSGTSISSFGQRGDGYHRGHVTASLPLDSTTQEVVAKGYYRDRKMELFACSFDEDGKIIERVSYACRIHRQRESAGQRRHVHGRGRPRSTSVDVIEQRRKKTFENFRAQFKGELSSTASTSGIGWLRSLFAAAVGNWIGIIFNALALFRRSKRRALVQRWHARKRIILVHHDAQNSLEVEAEEGLCDSGRYPGGGEV